MFLPPGIAFGGHSLESMVAFIFRTEFRKFDLFLIPARRRGICSVAGQGPNQAGHSQHTVHNPQHLIHLLPLFSAGSSHRLLHHIRQQSHSDRTAQNRPHHVFFSCFVCSVFSSAAFAARSHSGSVLHDQQGDQRAHQHNRRNHLYLLPLVEISLPFPGDPSVTSGSLSPLPSPASQRSVPA